MQRPWARTSGQDIEQDRDRAGDQRGNDHAEAYDQNIDAKPVGQTRANAHDFALCGIENVTTVHDDNSPRMFSPKQVQTIGSGPMAALTNSSEAISAPARLTAT